MKTKWKHTFDWVYVSFVSTLLNSKMHNNHKWITIIIMIIIIINRHFYYYKFTVVFVRCNNASLFIIVMLLIHMIVCKIHNTLNSLELFSFFLHLLKCTAIRETFQQQKLIGRTLFSIEWFYQNKNLSIDIKKQIPIKSRCFNRWMMIMTLEIRANYSLINQFLHKDKAKLK